MWSVTQSYCLTDSFVKRGGWDTDTPRDDILCDHAKWRQPTGTIINERGRGGRELFWDPHHRFVDSKVCENTFPSYNSQELVKPAVCEML